MLDAPACPACGWQRPAASGDAGKALWRAELGRALPRSQAAAVVAGEHFCVASEDGTLVALDVANSAVAWERAATPARPRLVLAADDSRLFVAPIDMQPIPAPGAALIALDGATGGELWKFPTPAHSLSMPCPADGALYFTTSNGQLYALDDKTGALRWSVAHGGWGDQAPAIAAGVVVAGGADRELRAYAASNGAQLWRVAAAAPFAGAIRISGEMVYACAWDGSLHALDLRSGALRWRLAPERGEGLTSAPVIDEGRVFVGSRVFLDRVARAGNGYALLALDAATGSELWRFNTPKHITPAPAASDDTVFFCVDNGTLHALGAANGQPRWQATLEKRAVAGPQLSGDGLLLGDRAGTIYAFRWRAEPAAELEDPQAYIQRGEFEQAAEAYALRDECEPAARLYAGELAEPRHAAQLYERAGLAERAAQQWERAGEPRRARELYEQSGRMLDVARMWADAGELLQSAQLYEAQGELLQAAVLFEQSGDRGKAAMLYHQSGHYDEAVRIWQSLGEWERLADALAEDRQFGAAADVLAQHGQIERAAQLYEQGEQLAQALRLRVDLGHWERAADLALRAGEYEQAGAAYEHLNQTVPAARAYQHAAKALASATPPNEARVAELYERAAQLFSAAFEEDQALLCWREVRRFRHLPEIVVTCGAQQVFVEFEWNTLLMRVENTGYGPALGIRIALRGPFDVRGSDTVARLPAGRVQSLELYARPHRDERGKVPLEIAVSYADARGEQYQGIQLIHIQVQQHGMAASPVTPLEIVVESGKLSTPMSAPIQEEQAQREGSTMASEDEILQQEQLLSAHRNTLAHLLRQKALHGSAHAPPSVLTGIDEARAEIARIKGVLRGWGIDADDAPDDSEAPARAAQPAATAAPPIDRRALREAMIEHFSAEELATLCEDIEQDLAANGIDLRVNFEDIAGYGKEGKVRELIGYLERRGQLPALLAAVRRERPGSV